MTARLALLTVAPALLAALGVSADPDPALSALRAQLDRSPRDQRDLWHSLVALGERCLAAKPADDDWKALGKLDGKPVQLSDGPVAVKVLAGWTDRLPPFEARYRVWLVPAGGAAYLVAYPDGGLAGAIDLLERLQRNLAVQNGDAKDVVQEKARLKALLLAGPQPEAWFLTATRLHPNAGQPFGRGPVAVAVQGERLLVTPAGGETLSLPRPDATDLGRLVGRPFGVAQGGGGTRVVYVALDWSAYLASDGRRDWLIDELKHALNGVEATALVEGAVHLHSGDAAAAWPLADLRRGDLADVAVVPHTDRTVETLTAVAGRVEKQRGVGRAYFMTWNPVTTIPAKLRDGDVKRSPELAGLATRLAKLPLDVVQLEGDRLPCLAGLAGRRYYTAERKAEPSLRLPK